MTGSWYDVHEQTGVPESCSAGFVPGMFAKGRRIFYGRKENIRHPGEEPI